MKREVSKITILNESAGRDGRVERLMSAVGHVLDYSHACKSDKSTLEISRVLVPKQKRKCVNGVVYTVVATVDDSGTTSARP